jgi:hypothetical protein
MTMLKPSKDIDFLKLRTIFFKNKNDCIIPLMLKDDEFKGVVA